MARWKQTPEETYRFAVQAFFEPTDFLRTLQHWILFYVEDSETRKSVLRQHQRARDRQDRRALRRSDQEARPDLAHAGLGQDLHAAHRRAPDPGGQGSASRTRRSSSSSTAPSSKASSRAGSSGCSARCSSRTSRSSARAPRPSCSDLLDADFRGLIICDDPQVRGDPEGQLARATTSTSSSTRRTARSPRTSAPT